MKILVTEFRDLTHPQAGGAEAILFEIFGRFAAAGHTVDYLCCRHPGSAPEDVIQGVRVIRRGPQALFNYVVPGVYARELRRRRYDVIVEGIDKIPFLLPAVERRVPVVCVIPHLFGTTVFREASWPIASYVWAFERLIPPVYRRCRFSVLSETTRDDLSGRGIAADRIHVIRSGIDHGLYTSPAEKPARVRPTVLYLGRLKRYKGIDLAMEAVSRLRDRFPDIEYQVVGTGDFLDALKARAGALGVSANVSFPGHKSGADKVDLLRRADVLVYPSPKEGWGLSVIEANACGTVTVASNSPGLRESVVDGRTGFLVPHGDTAALADRIARLLGDPALYARMRAEALKWAQEFTWERAARETMDLLERAVRETPAT